MTLGGRVCLIVVAATSLLSTVGREGKKVLESRQASTATLAFTIFSVSEGRLSITKNPTILVDSSTIIRKTFLLLDS